MIVKKESFLSNLIGEDSFENCSELSKMIVIIGGILLLLFFILSHSFHSNIVNLFLRLTTGLSILFIGYVVMCIIALDIRVEYEVSEENLVEEKKNFKKTLKYKLTIVWMVILILLGLFAIYFTDKYRNKYDFECTTFWVDHAAHVYHLDWNDDCEYAENAEELVEMNGYEISESYSLCKGCKECAEEMEMEDDRLMRR